MQDMGLNSWVTFLGLKLMPILRINYINKSQQINGFRFEIPNICLSLGKIISIAYC